MFDWIHHHHKRSGRSLAMMIAAFCLLSTPVTDSLAAGKVAAGTRNLRIGVYYFPGWLNNVWGPPGGWKPIQAFPERKPLLGWYDQSSPAVLAQQLKWMAGASIDYVVMDWYYSHGSEHLDQGLNAYLSVPQKDVKFSLMWANHDETVTPEIFRNAAQIWIEHYLRDPRYLTVDGRPVVFIFSSGKLAADAKASGSSAKSYLAMARLMAVRAGFPGIYFVACTDDFSPRVIKAGALADGYDAVSAYQMHRKPIDAQDSDPHWSAPSHGWTGLAAAYQSQWQSGLTLSMPMVVPMISGLDRRPWGGFTSDLLHDRSIATGKQFERHLIAARQVMEQSGPSHSGLGVICCWNEFGEGAYVEPTQGSGTAKLDAIRNAFDGR